MLDFYSDTKTKPTRAMRESVLDCEVGDEQKGEDPTTNRLCERVAELLGKEAAIFLPSGTMCNEIAINMHTSPGDEVICDRSSHVLNFETGGPAALSGVSLMPLAGQRGMFDVDQVAEAIRPASRYAPNSTLLCVEQTTNMGGGAVWPLEQMRQVSECARSAGLATHMDGARLMNAVVKSGVSAQSYATLFDSVFIDFSKGLGAPVGGALAGSASFIADAWRVKQRMGGALRQSGVLTAMCLHALDHHVSRLEHDHNVAAYLGTEIAKLDLVSAVLPVETNIVIFDIKDGGPTASAVTEALAAKNIVVGAFGERRIRLVTHLDVDQAGAETVMAELRRLLHPS